jgi:predicted MFS family arabinose efflux permease
LGLEARITSEHIIRQVLIHVSVIGFATALATRAVDPIVPLIADGLATDPKSVALLSTAFAVPFALVQPVLGPVADVIGKTRLMIICLVILVATMVMGAMAPSYEVLLASRILGGIATGGIFPAALAAVGDLVPVAGRQVALGRYLSLVITGNLAGVALAGFVGDLFGWRAVFATIAGCSGVALVSAFIGLRGVSRVETAPLDFGAVRANYRAILTHPRAKFCYAAVFVEGLTIFGVFPFVALLLLAAGEARASIAGLVLAGISFGGIIYSMAVRGLLVRFQSSHLMLAGGTAAAIGLLVASFQPPWPVQALAFLVLGFGFYTMHGGIQVQATELSSVARGAAVSLHSLFFFMGHAAGPVLYGLGFATIGPTASLMIGAAGIFGVGLMTWRFLGERPTEA